MCKYILSSIIVLLTISPGFPQAPKYDDDMSVHPAYTIHNIGSQSQLPESSRRNNTDNSIWPDALKCCPQVMGFDYLSNGKLVLVTQWDHPYNGNKASRNFSRMYIYSKDIKENELGSVSGRQISGLIYETSGMIILNDTIYLAQKTQLVYYPWKEADTSHIITQADLEKHIVGVIPMDTELDNNKANFQEYPCGILYRNGKFYIPNTGSVSLGGRWNQDIDVFTQGYTNESGVGAIISLDRQGKMDIIANGLRGNNGIGWGPGPGPDERLPRPDRNRLRQ